jgi:hypothetical protein
MFIHNFFIWKRRGILGVKVLVIGYGAYFSVENALNSSTDTGIF